MKKIIVGIVSIILIMFISASCLAETNNTFSAEQPYKLILEAFKRGDVDRALHWIKTTIDDFPNSEEAMMAHWLRIPIMSAEIWANLDLHNAYTDGAMNGLKMGDFYASLSVPTWQTTVLNSLLTEDDVDNGIPSFLNNYSLEKSYNFGLKSLSVDKTGTDVDTDLRLISLGINSSSSRLDLKKKLVIRHLADELHLFSLLEISDLELRAHLFFNLARSLYIGLRLINSDKIAKDIYGKYNEEIIQTALKCADLAIEHISNPYTDIKIDIEELKEDLLEMKAELE